MLVPISENVFSVLCQIADISLREVMNSIVTSTLKDYTLKIEIIWTSDWGTLGCPKHPQVFGIHWCRPSTSVSWFENTSVSPRKPSRDGDRQFVF